MLHSPEQEEPDEIFHQALYPVKYKSIMSIHPARQNKKTTTNITFLPNLNNLNPALYEFNVSYYLLWTG
ncbi:MAG: hypothetical protein D3916_14375 [Candidatus Electrothrix sp. MAN1_4]|nr:hypothetical protein [Candidatus Electrothrix sp. MAN1_4]